jgi:hypothetical protein
MTESKKSAISALKRHGTAAILYKLAMTVVKISAPTICHRRYMTTLVTSLFLSVMFWIAIPVAVTLQTFILRENAVHHI